MKFSVRLLVLGVFLAIGLFFALLRSNHVKRELQLINRPDLSSDKKYQITGCVMFGSEQPYALEWIEFHRRQGYEKFMVYYTPVPADSDMMKNVIYLQTLVAFYKAHGLGDLIEVIPAISLVPDYAVAFNEAKSTPKPFHNLMQGTCYTHCLERHRRDSHWVAVHDLDEYLFAPKFDSVWDFLKSSKEIGYRVQSIPFGLSGNIWNYHNDIVGDPGTGHLNVTFDPRDNSEFVFRTQERIRTGDVQDLSRFEPRDDLDFFRLSRYKDVQEFINVTNEETDVRTKLDVYRSIQDGRYNRNIGPVDMPLWPPSKDEKDVMSFQTDEELLESWADYYPLVTEEQVRRMPTIENSETQERIGKLFMEECRDLAEGDEVPNVCKGVLPKGYTRMGKGIYNMRYSNLEDRSLRSCRRPWIHSCSEGDKQGKRANPVTELRLDHHQVPSLEKRTTAQTSFRKSSAMDLLKNDGYQVMEESSSIYDDSKLRFIPDIRNQIRKFKPIPRYKDILLVLTDTQSIKSTHVDRVSQCTPLEVKTKMKVMCPAEHPRVGFWRGADSGAGIAKDNAYQWCTNHTGVLDGFHMHTPDFVYCPGHPDISCCNFEAKLEHLQ